MKPFSVAAALIGLLPTALAGSSKVVLPTDFKPPQVFKNDNLVQIVSLEKNFVKTQINVRVENVAKESQDDYYLPFTSDQMARVGGLEVKDRQNADAGSFGAEIVEFDPTR